MSSSTVPKMAAQGVNRLPSFSSVGQKIMLSSNISKFQANQLTLRSSVIPQAISQKDEIFKSRMEEQLFNAI